MKKVVGIGLVLSVVLMLLLGAYLLFAWRTARFPSFVSSIFAVPTTNATPTLQATATAVPPTPTPEPTATLEATATPAPTETAVAATLSSDLPVITFDNDFAFSSYQFNVDFTFTSPDANGVEQVQQSQIVYRFRAEPLAKGLEATIDGLFNMTAAEVKLYELDGRTSAVLPTIGCVGGASTVEQLASPFASLVSPDQLLTDLSQAERVLPDETISGIPVAHYLVDPTMLNADKVNLDELDGHLYVALEGGYLVQLTLDGQGSVKLSPGVDLENGRLHFVYTLSQVDQPLAFTLPADCATP